MADKENYPNRVTFHSQTEILFLTQGRKYRRESTRLHQKIYVDLMRERTLMPYLRQASLHIPCNYGEGCVLQNKLWHVCMHVPNVVESHFSAITKRT